MMKTLDTLHRWTGGLIGLVLALLGLSGTILLYEHLWIGLPGTGDPLRGDLATVAATTEKLMAMPGQITRSGYWVIRSTESKRSLPQVGKSEGKPSPRKLSALSVMIAFASPRVAETMIGDSTLGSR